MLPNPLYGYKISPRLAQVMIDENLNNFVKVELILVEYHQAIARAVKANMPSGGVFDALIAEAAVKAQVDRILTFNAKDFRRLGEDVAALVWVPDQP
jgi:predicted nucleic acid-binding protein